MCIQLSPGGAVSKRGVVFAALDVCVGMCVCPSGCMCACPSGCMCACPSGCMCLSVWMYVSVRLDVCVGMSVCPSACLCGYVSIEVYV